MYAKPRIFLICSLILLIAGVGIQPGHGAVAELAPRNPQPPASPENLFLHRAVDNQVKLAFPEDAGPPLPGDCSSLASGGGSAPPYCVYGYVYLDGSPVAGADVDLVTDSGEVISTTTAAGPDSTEPYFAIGLDGESPQVSAGDVIEVQASTSAESGETAFLLVNGAQQVDVMLSTSCGPTNIPGGVISANTTWTRACSPYIIQGNTLISGGFILTIEPGVTVAFGADKALDVEGELNAQGAQNAMIRFTSFSAETPGAWGYILFSPPPAFSQSDTQAPDQASQISYALVEYAGGTSVSDNAAVRVDAQDVDIDTTIIRNSASDGVRLFNEGSVYIENCLISDNDGWGVYVLSSLPDVYVTYSTISENMGGGVYIRNSPDAWVYGNYLRNPGGRGVELRNSSTVASVAYNTITGHNKDYGAGIYVYSATAYVDHNWIHDNHATQNGGGMYLQGPTTADDNLVLDNVADNNGGGVHIPGNRHNVNFNVFSGNQSQNGGGIHIAATGDTTCAYNSILYNTSSEQGAAIRIRDKDVDCFYNTIYQNTPGDGMGSVEIENYPNLHENNLVPGLEYTLFNGNPESPDALIAENNWWGSQFLEVIASFVWDWYDDSNLGVVDYDPPLANWVLSAPLTPPRNLSATEINDTIALSWSENPESDVLGYKVYYDSDAAGYPYDGSGADQGDSPIDVGGALNFDLTGLPPGYYHLAVTAYDNDADGADDWFDGHESWFTRNQTVLIGEVPQASFSATPISGSPPLDVQFTDASTGDFSTWDWDFGDGSYSNLQNPAHTYTQEGTYTVTLTVDGPTGSDHLTRSGYISAYAPPLADFSAIPTNGTVPLEVSFTDNSTGTIDSWNWDFGDGGSSDMQNPTYIYESAGVYTVTLQVGGPGGSDNEVKSAFINVAALEVAADFSASPTSGNVPLAVQFTDHSSGDITDWIWDFGDGGSSGLQNPDYVYTTAGVYTVTLNVSGPAGSDSEVKQAYINAGAGDVVADFSATPTSGDFPLDVQFQDLSSGAVTNWYWDFGDGSNSTQVNPMHTYTLPGEYDISLMVSSASSGNTLTRPNYIHVSAARSIFIPLICN